MLTILITAAIVGAVLAVPSPEKKAVTVVERRVIVIERPVYIQAQINLIVAQIRIDEAKREPEPVRLPEARALVRSSTAIERYRRNERGSS